MIDLFEFDDNKDITPTPQSLVIPVFNDIWKRDKSKDKRKAMRELGYIWYMCVNNAKKNPYYERYADDEENRSKEIIMDVFEESWKPDKLILEGIEKFNKLNYSESADTRDALISTKKKLKDWFKLYDPSKDLDGLQLQRNTKSIQELTKAIKEYNTLVEGEEQDFDAIRGGGSLGEFEE